MRISQMPQLYLESQETGRQGSEQVEDSEALAVDTNFKRKIKKKKKKSPVKAKPFFNIIF